MCVEHRKKNVNMIQLESQNLQVNFCQSVTKHIVYSSLSLKTIYIAFFTKKDYTYIDIIYTHLKDY